MSTKRKNATSGEHLLGASFSVGCLDVSVRLSSLRFVRAFARSRVCVVCSDASKYDSPSHQKIWQRFSELYGEEVPVMRTKSFIYPAAHGNAQ